ncbi:hypothetical protein [Methylobacterium brachythecii]|uniref:DUF3592 domain-containing protein n=1 Tax=Methylobacterium brachythecii TaxID=1176177 RepID=A0A7W6ADG4_9HYPH|nr:hypothetical protein [Methylobacterium brachythecii]MBB3901242.1 hypothetical protein [Methylobacterium brachythecii]GLS44574.1 hypothetical protein GCM10007884_25620 [Methylobacterium brachythecii]
MTDGAPLSAFPRRPLALKAGWRAQGALYFGAFMVLASLAGAVFIGISQSREMQDQRIWREGRPVPVKGIHGRCRNNLILAAQCSLTVSYEPSPGKSEETEVSALVFGGLDNPLPRPVAKIDPADPHSLALNAMVDAAAERWIAVAELTGGLVFLSAVVAFGVWMSLREAQLWRILVKDPQPVAARVIASRYVKTPDYAREFTFEVDGPDGPRRSKQRLGVVPANPGVYDRKTRYREPIPLDQKGTRLLALTSPQGALLVATDSARSF